MNSAVTSSRHIKENDRRLWHAGVKVFIHPKALAFIERASTDSPRTETGGILAGRGSLNEGEVHITHASGPGPRARRTRSLFARDTAYCQRYLDQVAKSSAGVVDYLGEWHKHHQLLPQPSWRDLGTAAAIARSGDYHVSLCLLLIIGASNWRSSLRAFRVNTLGRVMELGWSVCDDSPCFEVLALTDTFDGTDSVEEPVIDLGDGYDREVSGRRESQEATGSAQETGSCPRQR